MDATSLSPTHRRRRVNFLLIYSFDHAGFSFVRNLTILHWLIWFLDWLLAEYPSILDEESLRLWIGIYSVSVSFSLSLSPIFFILLIVLHRVYSFFVAVASVFSSHLLLAISLFGHSPFSSSVKPRNGIGWLKARAPAPSYSHTPPPKFTPIGPVSSRRVCAIHSLIGISPSSQCFIIDLTTLLCACVRVHFRTVPSSYCRRFISFLFSLKFDWCCLICWYAWLPNGRLVS